MYLQELRRKSSSADGGRGLEDQRASSLAPDTSSRGIRAALKQPEVNSIFISGSWTPDYLLNMIGDEAFLLPGAQNCQDLDNKVG